LHGAIKGAICADLQQYLDDPMHRRQFFLTFVALLMAGLMAPAQAQTPVFFADGGTAINGYDTVAYFTQSKPVKGRREFSVMWKGVVWRFANDTNRQTFEADPWAYAPQYGGYCAYGVSMGYRDATVPDAWQIVDGKLYLTRTRMVQAIWKQDLGGHIIRANANWPGVLSH
jgi:YHS domain-containing protein